MNRLVYLSRIRSTAGQLEPGLIAEILRVSVERNQTCGVTGALLALDGWFVQLIEGPAASVDATFERIARDTRHGFVKVLDRQAVSQRLFGDWSMCARALSPTDVAITDTVGTSFNIVPDKFSPGTAISLLLSVRKVQEQHIVWI
jgi:hypothetical protein